jgi:hypothetical protein
VKYNIAGAGLVGKTLAGIIARQGMRALIANSRGPKSRAEMAAEQFRRAVGLEKKWFFAVWTGRSCCGDHQALRGDNCPRARRRKAPESLLE